MHQTKLSKDFLHEKKINDITDNGISNQVQEQDTSLT